MAPTRTRASAEATRPVSPGNPCPFLRALVARGDLPDGRVAAGTLASTISRVARSGDGAPALPAAAIQAIAVIAHGLLPWQVARSQLQGVRLDGLRDGPLDKHGVGSGILDAQARVVMAELDRLAEFASPQAGADGHAEPGLDLAALKRYMDANAERARGRRRLVDRSLMDGEWPVLLKVLGQDGPGGRFLAVADVRRLFVERRLPARMEARLAAT